MAKPPLSIENSTLFKQGFKLGEVEGKKAHGIELLGWLYKKYLRPEVIRDSPEGKAILQLARELSEKIKNDQS